MWVHRLGLAKAKYYALTGEWVSGKEAAKIELINFSYPLEELDERVQALAEKLAQIPLTQLVSMKLIVNQAYDNMGLQSTQTLGPILDGIMRVTVEVAVLRPAEFIIITYEQVMHSYLLIHSLFTCRL